jgi:anti-sigma B factor antagonist
MGVRMRKAGEVVVLELEGEITLGGNPVARPLGLRGSPLEDVRGSVVGALGDGHRKVLLDLSRVTFLDSAGLGELVACKKRAVALGGDVKLMRPMPRVHDLLRFLKLTSVLETHEDEDAALRSFA